MASLELFKILWKAFVLLQSLNTSCWLYTWEQKNSSNKFAANLNMKGMIFFYLPCIVRLNGYRRKRTVAKPNTGQRYDQSMLYVLVMFANMVVRFSCILFVLLAYLPSKYIFITQMTSIVGCRN